MVNYSNGKIYKIQPTCESADGEVYYGSTTKKYLSQRLVKHRASFKFWSKTKTGGYLRVYTLFEKYGVDNCKIVLVERLDCDSKDKLLAREKHYIQSNKCVNKANPVQTAEEKKQWYEQYYENNKEVINQRKREYNNKHKDVISAKRKVYREQNDLAIKAKKNAKFECECGGSYSNSNKQQHIRCKKHQDFIKQ